MMINGDKENDSGRVFGIFFKDLSCCVSYLWGLRLDFACTGEGSVDFTHDCNLISRSWAFYSFSDGA